MFRQLPTMLVMLLPLCALPLVSQTTADDHIVPAPVLHQSVRSAAQAREANLVKIEKLFSSEPAQNAFRTIKIDPARVTRGIALLSDDEIARLAAQSEKIENDLAAGALTNQQITYILIALATAVIILVIVER
ncbi:MAG TPA: hypothetical protein VJN43_12515 [Bryobacteraceae bacterium]|nr:hypothetical protein [Bryobacteraceae bacterium]